MELPERHHIRIEAEHLRTRSASPALSEVCLVEMGDVADILGLGSPASASGRASPALGGPLGPLQENKRGKGGTSTAVPFKKGKPQGVSREVYALLGSEGLPPEVRLVVVPHISAHGGPISRSCWC